MHILLSEGDGIRESCTSMELNDDVTMLFPTFLAI